MGFGQYGRNENYQYTEENRFNGYQEAFEMLRKVNWSKKITTETPNYADILRATNYLNAVATNQTNNQIFNIHFLELKGILITQMKELVNSRFPGFTLPLPAILSIKDFTKELPKALAFSLGNLENTMQPNNQHIRL